MYERTYRPCPPSDPPGPAVTPEPSAGATSAAQRECACVALNTEWIVQNLTYAIMEKHYGRRVTRENGVAWSRCPHCHGSGVDRRP